MMLLDRVGVGQGLEKARINVFGYVEGSYNYNFSNAPRQGGGEGQGGAFRQNVDRLFDFEDNVARLNQLDLSVERKVSYTSGQWDLGFRGDFIFGSDSRLIHGNGLDFYGANGRSSPRNPLNNYQFDNSPENQFDIYQAYVDVAAPLGRGVRVRLGKFASFFGGTVDPNGNTFFSHTIAFAADHPFSFTGVMATYAFSDQVVVDGGFSRGWSQSLYDNNGAIDGFGRLTWLINEQTSISVAAITGPEEDNNNSTYRTMVEATLKYQATDRLRFILDGVFGNEPHALAPFGVVTPGESATHSGPETQSRNSHWYGVMGYAGYIIDPHATFNVRGEYFRDEEGTQTGIVGTAMEATVGLTLTPFPESPLGQNFKLRPEVRVDYSPQNRYDFYSKHEQVTFGIDAIFNF